MKTLRLSLMSKSNRIKKAYDFEPYDEDHGNSTSFFQGYNIEDYKIFAGYEFTIDKKWENATISCEGKLITLISLDESEADIESDDQLDLLFGTYLYKKDGKTIKQISYKCEEEDLAEEFNDY